MNFAIRLTGTKPLLMHNSRLSNPLDPYTRRLKELNAKRQKTDADYMEVARTEARGSVWEAPGGMLGLPTANVWRCLYDAATAFKKGEALKRGLLYDDDVLPLLIEGVPIPIDAYLADPEHIHYGSVKVQRNRVMRARPRLRHWQSSDHPFELYDDVLNLRDLKPIVERAGRLIGIGDWRPLYGRFTAEIIAVGGASDE